jgi:hypothetical protein
MSDFEAAKNRLTAALQGGPARYVVCLRDDQPFGELCFHWYPTKAALFAALKRDFFCFANGCGEDDAAEEFIDAVTKLIAGASGRKTLEKSLAIGLSNLLSGWSVEFLGTYEELLRGRNAFARSLRERFRESRDDADEEDEESEAEAEGEAEDEPAPRASARSDAPITKQEQDSFAEFVSRLPWE